MKVKFYTDEHISNSILKALRKKEIDVLTMHEAGRAGDADSEQLEFARTKQRVIVTNDSDFLILHDSGIDHAGIAFVTSQFIPVGVVAEYLVLIHEVLTMEEMRRHVEFISKE